MDDTIIAVINDDIITYHDLTDHLDSIYSQLKREGESQKEIERTMYEIQKNGLNLLIEHKLILDAAQAIGMTVKPEAINKKVEEIKKNYPNEQTFIDALVVNGDTITDLRDTIEEQLKINYIVDLQVRSKISVNPQEVTDYYNAHLKEFQKPEIIKTQSIFIQYTDDRERDHQRADAALSRLNSGEDFDSVHRKYSNATSINSMEKGTMIPQIEDIVFNLQPGDISPLIETEQGIFIFKIIDSSQAQTKSLDEVKGMIEDRIFREKFKTAYTEWVNQLKDKAYIEYKQ
jgi:parvulin-like peptidyl-prolyl isomerase